MLADIDKNGNANIDFDEFIDMMTAKMSDKDTREDLENRCLQLQQKKVLGIDQPKEEEFKVPTYAQVSQVDESQENLEEQAQPQMLPQQENKFRLPQETQVGNAVESKTSEVTPDVSAQNIPQQNIEMNTEQSVAPAQAVPVQEVPAQPVVLDQPQISNIQLEQPVQEVMPRDDYTYIPSSAPAVDLLAQRGSRLDTYTYIPSQENVLKKQEEPAINKYIPSQEGAKINKTYDNSGLASALQRADRAEQQAIEILNGKFRHM